MEFVHSVLCPFGLVTIKDIQTHPPSEVVEILLMMRNVLNRMGKIIKKILRFLFFELSRKIHRKLRWWRHKNDHNSKINIGKISNLIFLLFQPIAVNLTIWKKMYFDVAWYPPLCRKRPNEAGKSGFVKTLWKLRNVLNRMGKIIKNTAYSASFIKFPPLLRGGDLHILNWEKAAIFIDQDIN